jgi:hypothetical protein
MSKTKTYPGLGSLEAELRGRIDEELDAYASPFGRKMPRFEPEPRVTAEAIVEAVLARRASSAPPPSPSSGYPMMLPSIPPPPLSYGAASWSPPAPPAPRGSFATYAAIVAVITSFAVLFVTATQRSTIPTANAAEAKAPAAPLPTVAPGSCVDRSDDAPKAKPADSAAPTAKTPLLAPRPTQAVAAPRTAQPARTAKAEEPKPEPAPTAAATTANLDQAAKTAQMLREQLGSSLR